MIRSKVSLLNFRQPGLIEMLFTLDENAFASGNNENFDPFGINASNNNDKVSLFLFYLLREKDSG